MTSRTFDRHASIPAASVGVGFKPEHAEEALHADHGLGFFEVHAENYMGDGGAPHRMLTELRARAPLSLHGVGALDRRRRAAQPRASRAPQARDRPLRACAVLRASRLVDP